MLFNTECLGLSEQYQRLGRGERAMKCMSLTPTPGLGRNQGCGFKVDIYVKISLCLPNPPPPEFSPPFPGGGECWGNYHHHNVVHDIID